MGARALLVGAELNQSAAAITASIDGPSDHMFAITLATKRRVDAYRLDTEPPGALVGEAGKVDELHRADDPAINLEDEDIGGIAGEDFPKGPQLAFGEGL